MKNLVAVLVITAASVAIAVIVLFTVNRRPDSRLNVSSKMQVTSSAVIRVIKFQGHEYLAYNINKGGSLCHSETCPCIK
jgi:hypothetical protein